MTHHLESSSIRPQRNRNIHRIQESGSNKKADEAGKASAENAEARRFTERFTSLAYINHTITKRK